MTDATLKLIISLQDKASAGLKAIQGVLGRVAGGVRDAAAGFGDFLKSALAVTAGGLIQKGIEGIAGSLGTIKDGMIAGNAEFERYGVQFGVLLGNADAAKERLDELAQFGASTPFELPQVVRADKILQSFGLHAVDAAQRFGFAGTDIRRIAGDVAAGTGADFEEISRYIGQFASGSTGETIARFQELGIVTKAQLTEMGLAFDKGGSLIINSQEDLDRATGILLKGMEDKFGGMMDAQSATFEGMLSNLADWKSATLRTIGAPIFEVLRTHLQQLLAWLPSQQPRIEAFANALAGGLARGIPAAERLASTAINLARYLISVVRAGDPLNDWLTHLPEGMRGTVQTGGQLLDTLIRVSARITDWVLALTSASEWSSSTAETIRTLTHELGVPLPIIDGAIARWTALAGALSGPLTAAWGWLTDTALPAAQGGLTTVQGLLDPFIAAWGEGGIAGVLALVGERFPAVTNALSLAQSLLQPLADAVQPVIAGFAEGGLAGGLQALYANALPILGAISDLRTNLLALGLEGIGGLLTQVGAGNPALESLGALFMRLGGFVRQVAGWFQEQLLPALLSAGQGFLTMLQPHLEMIGRILVEDLWPILQDVANFLMANLPGAINVLAPLLTGVLDAALSVVAIGLRAIATTWETYLKPALEALGGWIETITGGWDNLARGAGEIKRSFEQIGEAARNVASGNIQIPGFQMPSLPGFAGGVANFAGGLAVVGERGPEIVRLPGGSDVIPSGRAFAAGGQGNSGGDITATINLYVDDRNLGRQVQSALLDLKRRNGSTGL